ncbi:hypothetical protein FG475_15275 [Vibrio navarrensis]|uniref:hypothetical protein n=1 Tax=Vibrio navarrensis TaxID=29495 RepID=UPI0018DE3275|nr:hypothetical protein [Vibrio navarrensis]EHA1126481.1 hypothetical protein [Vibrio navarrensis]MBH9740047.1 hypothetical protein [Vibrio navarrensis]HDY8121390.1 hypothetical protein [Vibrio vulnificus]
MKAYSFTFLLLGLCFSPLALSAMPSSPLEMETTSETQIERLVVFSQSGNGDLLVSVKAPSERCAGGYFVKKSSPGYEGIFSVLLAAHQAHSKVKLTADPAALWPSYPQPTCEVLSITLP